MLREGGEGGRARQKYKPTTRVSDERTGERLSRRCSLAQPRPRFPNAHLIRFFDLMRGALRAAPTSVEPVSRMPLQRQQQQAATAERDARQSRARVARAVAVQAGVAPAPVQPRPLGGAWPQGATGEAVRTRGPDCLRAQPAVPPQPSRASVAVGSDHAAPMTDSPMDRPIPIAPYE